MFCFLVLSTVYSMKKMFQGKYEVEVCIRFFLHNDCSPCFASLNFSRFSYACKRVGQSILDLYLVDNFYWCWTE